MKFFPDFSLHLQNKVLLLHHQNLLSYGVTVTQQILVLLFQVRILVAQLKKDASHAGHPFSFSGYFPASCALRWRGRAAARSEQTVRCLGHRRQKSRENLLPEFSRLYGQSQRAICRAPSSRSGPWFRVCGPGNARRASSGVPCRLSKGCCRGTTKPPRG